MSIELPNSRDVQAAQAIPSSQEPQTDAPLVDSGLSSIEKSKSVLAVLIPLTDVPVLPPPSSNQQDVTFAVASVDSHGNTQVNILKSFELAMSDTTTAVVRNWAQSMRDQAEEIRRILASPSYQMLQELNLKGYIGNAVNQVEGSTAAATAVGSAGAPQLVSTLDRLQAIEYVPPTAQIPDPEAPQDSSRALVIPLTAALLIGGGLALGGTSLVASVPGGSVDLLTRAVELVGKLQPLLPQLSLTDIIPMINLMVVGPIYYRSWDEAVSNSRNRERHSHIQAVQEFAKDVIKIVSDPAFVPSLLINRSTDEGGQLTADQQDRLTRMAKFVVIGIALGLLYSIEVGKVQQGKFWGMEPQEMRDLLAGKFVPEVDPKKKMTVQEQLTMSLIKRASEQLSFLDNIEDRIRAADVLLKYIGSSHELEPMLDPAKVFNKVFDSMDYKTASDKIDPVPG